MRSVDLREDRLLPKINCPVLVTRRLVLRLPHSEDIEALVYLADNRRIISQFDNMPSPFTRAAAEDFVCRAAKGQTGHYVYAVTRADTGEFIGCCGFGRLAGKPAGEAGQRPPMAKTAGPAAAEAAAIWPYLPGSRPENTAAAAGALLPPEGGDSRPEAVAQTEIFFWLGEPYWRRGYGTEIATALVDAAFRATELPVLYACLRDGNIAARKIVQKCGFSLLYSSGHVAKGGDTAQAMLHYSLSRDCWLDLRRSAPRRAV